MSTNLIYPPRGRAGEYARWALNIYRGCTHSCSYCYAPDVLRLPSEDFHAGERLRLAEEVFFARLGRDAKKLAMNVVASGATLFHTTPPVERLLPSNERLQAQQVFLCFTGDPYCPADVALGYTRRVIEVLHSHGLSVVVLTKGGMRALRDIDLFGPADAFASTLTCVEAGDSLTWEPGAQLPASRLIALQTFHDKGVPTWVSMEPVLNPAWTLDLIRMSHPFVDYYKVGKLNRHPLAATIDWGTFGHQAESLLQSLGKPYLIKHDLRMAMEAR